MTEINAIRAAVAEGLLAQPAWLEPKYFYDDQGSRLFSAICALEEYYPTRTEAAIMAEHLDEIGHAIHQHFSMRPTQDRVSGGLDNLIDLGAGDGAKAARLFDVLRPQRYVAVDVSAQFLHHSLVTLQRAYPSIEMHAWVQDFSRGLHAAPGQLALLKNQRSLMFYPGSSIGNFDRPSAIHLLNSARRLLDSSGLLLIGVDLLKDRKVLHAAYDDALGVTAAFNLNALRHLNQLIGADFKVEQWRHEARFNEAHSRIEMHLVAKESLEVRWPGGRRAFASGDSIHTENSVKYRAEDFADMLRAAGWAPLQQWTDARQWFCVFLAQAN